MERGWSYPRVCFDGGGSCCELPLLVICVHAEILVTTGTFALIALGQVMQCVFDDRVSTVTNKVCFVTVDDKDDKNLSYCCTLSTKDFFL